MMYSISTSLNNSPINKSIKLHKYDKYSLKKKKNISPTNRVYKNLPKLQDISLELLEIEENIDKTWIKPKILDKSIKRTMTCEICLVPIRPFSLIPLTSCLYCNIQVHTSCIGNINEVDLTNCDWACHLCIEELEHSKSFAIRRLKEKKINEIYDLAQTIISKTFRRYIRRKLYLLVRNTIICIQIRFRVFLRKKLLLKFREKIVRPINITIYNLTNLSDTLLNNEKITNMNVYIAITVYDDNDIQSMLQTWRFDTFTIQGTTNPSFNSTFMIPGVSGDNTIVLTVYHRGTIKDYMLGQTYIRLNINEIWRKGGHFKLNLNQEEYIVKDNNTIDRKSDRLIDYRIKPQGSIELSIEPIISMRSHCGYVFGSAIETILRTIKKLPKTNGIIIPSNQILTNTTVDKDDNNNQSNHQSNINPDVSTKSIILQRIIQKRIWITLISNKIYFYNRYGDVCKLIIQLNQFDLHIELYENVFICTLYKLGLPEITITPCNEKDAFLWKIALLSSYRYSKLSTNLSYDLVLVLNDMKKLDKYKKKKKNEIKSNIIDKPQKLILKYDTTLLYYNPDHIVDTIDSNNIHNPKSNKLTENRIQRVQEIVRMDRLIKNNRLDLLEDNKSSNKSNKTNMQLPLLSTKSLKVSSTRNTKKVLFSQSP